MQNRSISLTGTYTQSIWMPPAQPSYNNSTIAGHGGDTFSFGGFGSNDPRFKRKPVSGTYTKQYWWKPRGSYTYKQINAYGNVSYLETVNGALRIGYSLGTALVEVPPSAYNDALEKFYEKMKDSELNLAVSLGESRETLRMISSLNKLIRLSRQARRALKTLDPAEVVKLGQRVGRDMRWYLRLSNAKKISRAAAEVHLSYKYGWKPLAMDVHNAIMHNARQANSIVVRARKTASLPPIVPVKDTYKRSVVGKRDVRHLVQCSYKPGDQTAFDLSRLTSLDPKVILWELIPLSFVFDWLLNVGQYLSLQESALSTGLEFVEGFVTQTQMSNWTETIIKDTWTPAFAGSVQGARETVYATADLRAVSKSRTVLTANPRPVVPRVEVDLGASRIFSAAALCRVLLFK